jgi:hypothetical protein
MLIGRTAPSNIAESWVSRACRLNSTVWRQRLLACETIARSVPPDHETILPLSLLTLSRISNLHMTGVIASEAISLDGSRFFEMVIFFTGWPFALGRVASIHQDASNSIGSAPGAPQRNPG